MSLFHRTCFAGFARSTYSEGETNANPNPKMTTEHVAGYAQRRRRRRRRDCLAILQRHHILKSERRGDWEGRGDLDVRSPLASWHHLNLYIPSIYLSVQVENFINVVSIKNLTLTRSTPNSRRLILDVLGSRLASRRAPRQKVSHNDESAAN